MDNILCNWIIPLIVGGGIIYIGYDILVHIADAF